MSSTLTVKPHSLMGTSEESVRFTLPNGKEVETGPITVTLDYLSEADNNVGTADLATGNFQAQFAIQITAPGFYDLVVETVMNPSKLSPIRAMTYWQGRYTGQGTLEAEGTVEVLPGSIWAGTTGKTNCTGT